MGRGPGDSGQAACVAPPHPWRVGPGLERGLGKGPGDLHRGALEMPVQPGLAEGVPQSSRDWGQVDMPWTTASGQGRCKGLL